LLSGGRLYGQRVADEPLRCAGALIFDDDGRVFVQRRAGDRRLFPGSWDIVGGHVEPGETVTQALRREIAEETGWRLTYVLANLGPIRYVGDDGKERVEEDFLVRVDGDLLRPKLEGGKHTEYRWITEADVDGLTGDGPGDELARSILRTAFATAREFGLIA
jgi:8-oxo-dGTP pyrophosphatase MutT (NUDIX family)